MDKRSLSERDICTKYITPALKKAGWDIHSQVLEEVTLTHIYSTNGSGFVEHDRTGSLGVVEFVDFSGKIPRYYQLLAMNRTVEAITTGRERILLVVAPRHLQNLHCFSKSLAALSIHSFLMIARHCLTRTMIFGRLISVYS